LRFVATPKNSNVDKKSYEGQRDVLLCNYTDVYYNERLTDRLEYMPSTASDEEIAAFALREGDVIITKDSETADDIGVAAHVEQDLPGVVCGYHLCVLRPREVLGEFLFRVMQSHPTKAHFFVEVAGVTRYGLGQDTIRDALVPLPPIEAQRAICAWINRETAGIDALIEKKTRFIELLREKLQVQVTVAVTRGLGHFITPKESGIEWMPQIPAHWAVKQLKHVVDPNSSITYGIVQAGPEHEGGIPYIKTSDMAGDALPIAGYSHTSPEIEAAFARSRVRPGDLVISIRASIGKCLPVPETLALANLTQGTAKISPGPCINIEFLLAFIQSNAAQTYFATMAKGATFKEITLDALRRLPVLLPPLVEQIQVAQYVQQLTRRIKAIVSRTERSVDLLRERRAALITAAVTGQIDVRAEIPAEETEPA
jgi:type I restriction enzyme S subunit